MDLVRTSTQAITATSQARDDLHLLRLWLHGKSANTRDAYERDVAAFVDSADVPLQALTLDHLQAWADELEAAGLAASTRARKLSAVKSLLTFGHRLGYLPFNVGGAVRAPRQKGTLAERILPEEAVHRVLAHADALAGTDAPTGAPTGDVADDVAGDGPSAFVHRRNAVALRLFYATGGRVSELAALCWEDAVDRPDGGQLTLYGKGGRTRAVLLSRASWDRLERFRREEARAGHVAAGAPVLRSSRAVRNPSGRARPLSRQQLWRVVKKLARGAGLPEAVSPHFFRHAHASHALDRGAPPHLVQATLGHASLATTSLYTHARPDDSSGRYLGV